MCSKSVKMPIHTTELYGNCQVLSPDGLLMFKCTQKRIDWYLNRNLATTVNDDPLTIKLSFTPRGLGNYDKTNSTVLFENICVKCGTNMMLTKHHVVPYCYRKHFPISSKTRNHHDVLLLCIECHDAYERYANILKKELAIKYNAPIDGLYEYFDTSKLQIAKLASSLYRYGDQMSLEKRDFVYTKLVSLVGSDNFNIVDLMEIPKQSLKLTHGEIVVSKLESINDFIVTWRKHFVDIYQPKHITKNWDVYNDIL